MVSYFVIIFFLGVLDIYILMNVTYLFYYTFEEFLLIHLLICATYIYTGKFYKEKISIYLYLNLFFPGIGFFLTFFVNLACTYIPKQYDIMEEYEEYIKYIQKIELLRNIDLGKEIDTMSVNDKLEYGNDIEKKNAIIHFDTSNTKSKVNVLKKALKDKDYEVVHYAASTLNLMEDGYEREIDSLHKEYTESNDLLILEKLSNKYEEYIESGIMETEIEKAFIKRYLEVLKEMEKNFEISSSTKIKEGEMYLKLKDYKNAETIFDDVIKEKKDAYKAYIGLMKSKYYLGKKDEIINIASSLKGKEDELDSKMIAEINYWTGGGKA